MQKRSFMIAATLISLFLGFQNCEEGDLQIANGLNQKNSFPSEGTPTTDSSQNGNSSDIKSPLQPGPSTPQIGSVDDGDRYQNLNKLSNWGPAAQDIVKLSQYDIEIDDPNLKWNFETLFGPVEGRSLADFVTDRVKYVFDLEGMKRTHVSPFNDTRYFYFPEDDFKFYGYNVGIGYWLDGVFKGRPYSLKVQDKIFTISSPTENGVIQLGNYYDNQAVNSHIDAIKFSTLAHEARHSDCHADKSELDRIADLSSSAEDFWQRLSAQHPQCGHLHKLCSSAEHPELEGHEGCDTSPWGAFYVDFVTLKALQKNASEEEKVMIDMELMWIQALLQFDWESHYQGLSGSPVAQKGF